jgi:hypothetical protein
MYFGLLGVLLVCSILFYAAVKIVYSLDYPDSDFFSFWLAGRMNWENRDPYLESQWLDGHTRFGAQWVSDRTFLYPLPLAVLFAPFGLLPLDLAYIFWVFLSEIMIIASVYLTALLWKPPRIAPYILPALAAVFLFRPVLITLRNGQLGALLLFIITAAVFLLEKDHWMAGGLLLPLLILKPQLGFPLLIILNLWLLVRKKYATLAGELFSGTALFLLGWIRNPAWAIEFLKIGGDKVNQAFGNAPTLWGNASFLCRGNLTCSLSLGALFSSVLVAGTVFFLLKRQLSMTPAWAASIFIPAALLITPYSWAYDHCLLIAPLFVIFLHLVRKDAPYLLSSLFILGFTILSLCLLIVAVLLGTDVWASLEALVILVLSIVCVPGFTERLSIESMESSDKNNNSEFFINSYLSI